MPDATMTEDIRAFAYIMYYKLPYYVVLAPPLAVLYCATCILESIHIDLNCTFMFGEVSCGTLIIF